MGRFSFPCKRKVSQLCSCMRPKNLLLLMPVVVLFTWFCAYNGADFQPLGPLNKRSRDANTNLNDTSFVVYADYVDDDSRPIGEDTIDINSKGKGIGDRNILDVKTQNEAAEAIPLAEPNADARNTSAGSSTYRDPSLGFDPAAVRFRQAPFFVEKTFEVDVDSLEAPSSGNLLPDDSVGVVKDETPHIPANILRMLERNIEGGVEDAGWENKARGTKTGSVSTNLKFENQENLLNKPAPVLKPPYQQHIKKEAGEHTKPQHANPVPPNRSSLPSKLTNHLTDLDDQKAASEASANQIAADSNPTNKEKDGSHAALGLAYLKTKVDLKATEKVMQERQQLVSKVCEENKKLIKHYGIYDTHSIVNRNHSFLYCPVEKVASTFFRRFMFALEHPLDDGLTSGQAVVAALSQSKPAPVPPQRIKIPSPFHVPIQMALKHGFEKPRQAFRKGAKLDSGYVKFVAVREPYSRLFSAYVDKLLVPNQFYWKVWGVKIITSYRKSPSAQSLTCGHDVTFPEFVKYVIAVQEKSATILNPHTDPHFQPVTSLCWPCDVKYNVISRVETLREDFEYLIRAKLGVIIANFSFNNLKEDEKSDAIQDSVDSAFTFYQHVKTCLTPLEMGQRVWRKLQLRNIISDDLTLPFSEEQMESVSAEDFTKAVHKARDHWRSRDKVKMTEQKFRTLQEAYAKVPADDIRKFVKLFYMDFELFGYEKFPSFVIEPDQW